MNRRILGSISVLAIWFSVAPIVHAQSVNRAGTTQTTAFELSGLARNGYLANQGIPSAGLLSFDLRSGRVAAEDIVKAGIRANLVSPDTLNDQGYIRAIEYNLTDTPTGDNGN
ncbi:hypothetical protein H6F89_08400 [Cyanobacteria bacterium FACHB-63]|nr:hypothetical protein [Cyanobacteria bacterium FACHB-63]